AELLRAALRLAAGAGPDAVRAAAGDGWPAAALALGAIADDDPAVAPLLAAPGALRHAAAAVAARALLARAPVLIAPDDAHRADPTTLDALELATLAGRRGSLVAVVAGEAPRAGWGERAAASLRLAVAPLPRDAARAMLFDLLAPVEFIPHAQVARI